MVAQLLELADQRASPPRRCSTSPTASRSAGASASTTTTSRGSQEWVVDSGIRWGLDAGAPRRRSSSRRSRPARGGPGSTGSCSGVAMTEDGPALLGRRAAARRRRQRRDRPRRALRRVRRPPRRGRSTPSRGPQPIAGWAQALADGRRRPHRHQRARLLAAPASCGGCSTTSSPRPARGGPPAIALELADLRALLRRPPPRAPDARELPHRPPDHLHAGADALGAPPGRLPARPRRRRVPAQGAARRRRPAARATRTSATATRAARTARCCSTRCSPPSERLIITYTGNDERTNAPRPPAVPVGELLDVVDRTVRAPGSTRPATRSSSTIRCSRSTPATSSPARCVPGAPWSFDRSSLRGRERSERPAGTSRRRSSRRRCPRSTPRGSSSTISSAFVEHPVRAFLRQRLGISLSDSDDEVEDGAAGRARRRSSGGRSGSGCSRACSRASIRAPASAPRSRAGSLPPGALGHAGDRARSGRWSRRSPPCARGATRTRSRGRSDVNAPLGDGTILTGTVSGVRGDALLGASYSRLSPRHRHRGVGAAAGADRRRPEPAVRGGDGRPRADRSDAIWRWRGSRRSAPTPRRARERALGALERADRLARPRAARRAADPVRDRRRVCPGCDCGTDAEAAAGKAWTSAFKLRRRGRRPGPRARLRRHSDAGRAARSEPASRRAWRGVGCERALALRPLRAAVVG